MIRRARTACVRVAASALRRIASRRPRIDATVRGDSVVFCFDDIVQRLGRRLRIARAGQLAREIARLRAQPPSVLAEKGFQQAQQRAPALHRLAVVVNRGGVGRALIVEHRACFGQDVAGDGPERLADRNIRTHRRFLAHVRVL